MRLSGTQLDEATSGDTLRGVISHLESRQSSRLGSAIESVVEVVFENLPHSMLFPLEAWQIVMWGWRGTQDDIFRLEGRALMLSVSHTCRAPPCLPMLRSPSTVDAFVEHTSSIGR